MTRTSREDRPAGRDLSDSSRLALRRSIHPDSAPTTALTDRQREILQLAGEGLTNADIGHRLHLSVATVERHCTTMYRTLRVRNRAQAVGLVGSGDVRSPQSAPPVDGLTRRQVEILRLAGDGLTNADIGTHLQLSVATVERHCTTTYRTLGVRNRAQALALLGYPPIG